MLGFLNNKNGRFFISIIIFPKINTWRQKKLTNEKTVKIGDRVELLEMIDTMTKLQKGSKGTVTKIEEDQDLIWVDWDNGEKLALLADVDKFKIIRK
jgi:hypothetical protein